MAGTEARSSADALPRETLLGPQDAAHRRSAGAGSPRRILPHPVSAGAESWRSSSWAALAAHRRWSWSRSISPSFTAAEIALEHPVSGAVITVPVLLCALLNRQALRVAARLAGFQRLRLIAAALAALAPRARPHRRLRLGTRHFGAAIVELQDEMVPYASSRRSAAIGWEARTSSWRWRRTCWPGSGGKCRGRSRTRST